MREIKFRAWSNLYGCMCRVNAMCFGVGTIEPWVTFYEEEEDSSPTSDFLANCVLQQFTGLNDSNGKEIYEGDIVEYENNNAGYGLPRDREISRDIIPSLFEHEEYWMNPWWKSGEVIGNIYENPELVK